MTQDESEQIEQLVMVWYHWSTRYRPNLGAPKVSVYGKHSDSGDVYVDSEEVDDRIDAEKAAQIDACLDQLPWQQRSAVDIHACKRASGMAVMRNPRLTVAQSHSEYQAAKQSLLPMLKRRGMIRE